METNVKPPLVLNLVKSASVKSFGNRSSLETIELLQSAQEDKLGLTRTKKPHKSLEVRQHSSVTSNGIEQDEVLSSLTATETATSTDYK